ncbi:Long-chain-fatty-acid--CoA ligase 6 [Liparis tanakae]|uniref:Long-chain-fatty-acid--CoA ligase 6 n=1 Tax=Liparis tanakae TaxID=230148 RepID=A0A4Z2EDS5_9TELE|nr:Long-chain-fatty-acid--CoA ligase 6 [Liparis tanakae]
MEKMQAQEMMSGLRIPEMEDLGQFFRSLPTSTLVGIGALTAVLAYWLATRPRPITPPCSLLHQSEEVPVRYATCPKYQDVRRRDALLRDERRL